MTESQNQQDTARPTMGRAFLSAFNRANLPSLKTQFIFWSVTAFGIVLDLWTKSAVFNWLLKQEGYRYSIIDGFLHLVLTENEGAAFGIAGGQTVFLIIISAVALIIVIGVFLFGASKQKLMNISLALFTAGICGNLYDRIFNDGLVRDFIDVVYWPGRHWPAFNLADSMLCIGIALMIISGLFTTEHSVQKHAEPQK